MMKIVAEMMIFANAAVGERIFRAFPRAALLRRHPPPRRESFAEVCSLLISTLTHVLLAHVLLAIHGTVGPHCCLNLGQHVQDRGSRSSAY